MEIKTKRKMKTKTKIHFDSHFHFCFRFCFCFFIFVFVFVFVFVFAFSFLFLFLFLLSKSFCIFVSSTWPRGAIDSQLSLDWSRSAIAFLLTPRGLEVPQTVNFFEKCLLLACSKTVSYLAQKCHSIFVCNFARGLAVPQMVNSLLIGLEVHSNWSQHLEIWHLD